MRWINRRPDRRVAVALAAVPFAAVLVAYAVASDVRRAANPSDKLLPAPAAIADTALRLAAEPDRRSGAVVLWRDTGASLRRLASGVGLAAALGLCLGTLIGMLPLARAALAPFVAVLSMVPPLAILPILFIVLGLGEGAKVALIAIGVAPFLIRDLSQRVLEIPREIVLKAETLGATSWRIMMRIVLPQLLPRLLQATRLSLGPAWLFLIAAEAIAAEQGLGYRIFLVRRYLAMDVILPYVAWIALLAFVFDRLLHALSRKAFPWAEGQGL